MDLTQSSTPLCIAVSTESSQFRCYDVKRVRKHTEWMLSTLLQVSTSCDAVGGIMLCPDEGGLLTPNSVRRTLTRAS